VQQAVDRLAQGVPPWLYPEVIDQQVRIQVAQGRLEAAEQTLRQAGVANLAQAPERFTYPGEQLYLAALRLAAARLAAASPFEAAQGIFSGRRQAALEVASRIIVDAGAAQRQGVVLQARILRALLESGAADAAAADAGAEAAGAADAGAEAAGAAVAGAAVAGALDRALADLDEALTLAAPEGFLRVFVDEGPRMAALLRRALLRGMHVEFIQRLLALFPAENFAVEPAPVQSGAPASAAAPGLVEPLTERETAVLRCMGQGLKYEEIALTLRYQILGGTENE
jgi:LuxR family maltose regulon positive regulatory protein